ncbi:MAG: diaminopimelate epimerase [Mizugakiibacter sp.]|uniref:diaminopimelate epimerase n=1 Tax=Mizugakiibacter sp. TaxID=1972610 RepID=UPI0031C17E3F|nr:diaminopimelate epimerase [Xanthomonadaceae bacterium]
MRLAFTKMHGAGNDFAVLDARAGRPPLDASRVARMGDRHRGIGFDQLLTIEAADDPACAYAYDIWNSDGTHAQQCGNGVRCVAAWLHRAGALGAGVTRLQSPSGSVAVRLDADGAIAVDMGLPEFAPARIPFDAPAESDRYALALGDEIVQIGAVSMGNPHAVVEVTDAADPRIDRLGPALTAHPRFPAGANAGFAQVLGDDALRLRVHERGAGWTLACGTGACAAVAVLRRRGRVGPRVRVALPGGTLTIAWEGLDHPLWMSGPAAFVYEGEYLD